MANEPASMRTALSRVRHLGSARSGTKAAWHMRLTSAALIPLTIAFVWLILSLLGKDYNAVRSQLGSPVPAILMLLFLIAAIYHMQLGMQSIIEDYVHGEHAKSWSLIANTFFAACVGLACVYAVLRISFV
jgi:succinate dehydrogenase / fumarate reductase, membrane anchor subunit